jgi:hypothetical protein
MSDQISSAEVIQMIRDLVNRTQTATLYVRTDQNHVVIVATKGGEIITLSSGSAHGEKAIPVLREMQWATVRVDGNAIAYHSEAMPPTPTLLGLLSSDTQPASRVNGKRLDSAGLSNVDSERVKKILSELLSEYLGPIAPMFCEQVLESVGDSLDPKRLRMAVEKMAAEAGGTEEVRDFTNRAWKQLNL